MLRKIQIFQNCPEKNKAKNNAKILLTFLLSLTLFLQLGVAVGFVLPPMLVPNSENLETVGKDLQMMFYMVAGLTSVLLVLMVFCK